MSRHLSGHPIYPSIHPTFATERKSAGCSTMVVVVVAAMVAAVVVVVVVMVVGR